MQKSLTMTFIFVLHLHFLHFFAFRVVFVGKVRCFVGAGRVIVRVSFISVEEAAPRYLVKRIR